MTRLYHKTFVHIPMSERAYFVKHLDDQLNDFFDDYPNITIVNIAYEQAINAQGILIARTAFLTYSEEGE